MMPVFLLMLALSMLLRDRTIRAEFVRAGYRGSQALLGTALMQNIYGETGPLALVLIGAVPLYNMAVVLLEAHSGVQRIFLYRLAVSAENTGADLNRTGSGPKRPAVFPLDIYRPPIYYVDNLYMEELLWRSIRAWSAVAWRCWC